MHNELYAVRIIALMILLGGSFGLLSLHLYNLQVVRHAELLEKAGAKYTASAMAHGRRGQIFDLNGSLLAGNIECRDIMAEPRRFHKDPGKVVKVLNQIVPVLSKELEIPPAELMNNLSRAVGPGARLKEVVVARQVDIRQANRIGLYKFPGIRIVEAFRRTYPRETMAANLVGFTSHENTGASGIEEMHDADLQPSQRKIAFERDRRGNPLDESGLLEKEVGSLDGANIYLTIAEPVQQIVEEELDAMVEKHKPKAAYAVMVNPRTGAVMAMAQRPTFNPNKRSVMKPEFWQNRIASEGFEPGSVLKCFAVAGALDYGVVKLNDVYDCEKGIWYFCGKPLRDSGHSYGRLSVVEIIQKSSNIGTAKIAIDMGANRLFQTLYRFGYGRPTGIGFPNEASGIFRKVNKWDGLSISRLPIGQGILVTPLQLVQAFGALANEGLMMQLQLVDRIEDASGAIIRNFQPKVKHRTVRADTARMMAEVMTTVTEDGGTATRAAVNGYRVAGKTGTAQKVVDGRYVGKYVASFVGFVPAENPAFVLLVSADEPSENGYYGGTVAAPVFSRIAEKTLRYLQVAPARSLAARTLDPGKAFPDAASENFTELH